MQPLPRGGGRPGRLVRGVASPASRGFEVSDLPQLLRDARMADQSVRVEDPEAEDAFAASHALDDLGEMALVVLEHGSVGAGEDGLAHAGDVLFEEGNQ